MPLVEEPEEGDSSSDEEDEICERCSFRALPGSRFCGIHEKARLNRPLRRANGLQKALKKIRKMKRTAVICLKRAFDNFKKPSRDDDEYDHCARQLNQLQQSICHSKITSRFHS